MCCYFPYWKTSAQKVWKWWLFVIQLISSSSPNLHHIFGQANLKQLFFSFRMILNHRIKCSPFSFFSRRVEYFMKTLCIPHLKCISLYEEKHQAHFWAFLLCVGKRHISAVSVTLLSFHWLFSISLVHRARISCSIFKTAALVFKFCVWKHLIPLTKVDRSGDAN